MVWKFYRQLRISLLSDFPKRKKEALEDAHRPSYADSSISWDLIIERRIGIGIDL